MIRPVNRIHGFIGSQYSINLDEPPVLILAMAKELAEIGAGGKCGDDDGLILVCPRREKLSISIL